MYYNTTEACFSIKIDTIYFLLQSKVKEILKLSKGNLTWSLSILAKTGTFLVDVGQIDPVECWNLRESMTDAKSCTEDKED